jgi:CubicO group peptidase (beta-lactamase class C family)
MSLLGEAAADISKTSYESYIEKNILPPLQLTNKHFLFPQNLWRKNGNRAQCIVQGWYTKMMLFSRKRNSPRAGFFSNVIDLAHFASWRFHLLNTLVKRCDLKEMPMAKLYA